MIINTYKCLILKWNNTFSNIKVDSYNDRCASYCLYIIYVKFQVYLELVLSLFN